MSEGGEQSTVKFLNELMLCDYKCKCFMTQILTTKKDVNDCKLGLCSPFPAILVLNFVPRRIWMFLGFLQVILPSESQAQ